MLTYVIFQQYPVVRMFKLVPLAESAQVFLVILFQCFTVYLIVPLQRAGRYREGIQMFFLRHQRTPLSSWCLLQ